MSQQSYLILGGSGFVGRHLVQYLLDNDLASEIRVADKMIPAVAYLNEHHKAAFANPKVEFMSANLMNKRAQEKVFERKEPFDFVINLATESRYGLSDAIYYEGIFSLVISCAKLAAKNKAKRFVEISSGKMSSNPQVPHKETDGVNPWTPIACMKFRTEQALKMIPNLKYTVLRPAVIYGTGDKVGITPRLVMGAIYSHLNETMKVLWNRNLMLNTIHVLDLCRAIHYVTQKSEAEGQIYNVVDIGCTTQGIVNDFIAEIFNIKVSYLETMLTTLYKMDMETLVEEINEKHCTSWAKLCEKYDIKNTPLSSFLHKEDILNKHINLDGHKLSALGFTHQYPKITKALLLEVVRDYTERNLFPRLL